MLTDRTDRTVVRLHQRRTLEGNVGTRAGSTTLGSITLYLSLEPRPSRRWVRVFRGRIAGARVEVPHNYELMGGTPSTRRSGSGGRLALLLRWLPRFLYRGPSHLLVHNCDPDPAAVRAVIERVREVVRAVDEAALAVGKDRDAELRGRELARRQLAQILAESEPEAEWGAPAPRYRNRPSGLEEGALVG